MAEMPAAAPGPAPSAPMLRLSCCVIQDSSFSSSGSATSCKQHTSSGAVLCRLPCWVLCRLLRERHAQDDLRIDTFDQSDRL